MISQKLCAWLYDSGSRQHIYVFTYELFVQENSYQIKNYNHQSLQTEQGIKSLSTILAKHLKNLGQMWPKYFPVATLAYNTFNTPNLANYSPYELFSSRKQKLLLDFEIMPDIKVLGMFKDYYTLLNKRLQYLQKLL